MFVIYRPFSSKSCLFTFHRYFLSDSVLTYFDLKKKIQNQIISLAWKIQSRIRSEKRVYHYYLGEVDSGQAVSRMQYFINRINNGLWRVLNQRVQRYVL